MTLCVSIPIGVPADVAAAVELRGVHKTIDDRPILVDVTARLPRGGFLALLGANGAGKSTLLKVLAGLLAPSAGRIVLFGDALHRDNAAALRTRLGMIGHGSMLYRELTVLENLVFFGRLYDVPHPAARARTLLEELGLLHRQHDAVKTLSRGMTQRVSIARALMHDPDLLLADEPFTGLDAPSRRMLETLLGDLNARGRTIVLANHDIEQSLGLARQALVLRRGRVVVDAPTGQLDEQTVLAEVTDS